MVKLISKTEELKLDRSSYGAVGFVPTMGNLHQGHLSLLERALQENQIVYFSIFVNPKQFGPSEDFNRYPRTLENDLELISKVAERFPNSTVIVYSPQDPQEVFPLNDDQTISINGLSIVLEGKLRPGHFDGVATVVYRLFDLIKPAVAYFGLKDYQQFLVIKKMVQELAMPIKIVGMPIIRDTSGLALSSRNQYLSPEQKEASLILFKTLSEIIKIISHKRSNLILAQEKIQEVLKDPNWNYLEIRDAHTFSDDISHSKLLTILAVYQMGQTRLLDNMQVEIQ